MTRVLCAVALVILCAALGCAAQENSRRCGSAATAGGRCAITLADDNDVKAAKKAFADLKKINEGFTAIARDWYQKCNDVKVFEGSADAWAGTVVTNFENAKEFLAEYPKLQIQQYLPELKETSEGAQKSIEVVRDRREAVCTFDQQVSEKNSKFYNEIAPIEKSVNGLSTSSTTEEINEARKNAEDLRSEIQTAINKAKNEEKELNKKINTAEDATAVLKELYDKFNVPFQAAQTAYEKLKKECNALMPAGHIREKPPLPPQCEKGAAYKEEENEKPTSKPEEHNPSTPPNEEENEKPTSKPEEHNPSTPPNDEGNKVTVKPKEDDRQTDNSQTNDGVTRRGVGLSAPLAFALLVSFLC